MLKYLAVSVLLPLFATAIQFRSCSEGAPPLTVDIEGEHRYFVKKKIEQTRLGPLNFVGFFRLHSIPM
jgi:hypothetical protein